MPMPARMPQRRSFAADNGHGSLSPVSSSASSFTGGSCNDLQRYVLGLSPLSSMSNFAVSHGKHSTHSSLGPSPLREAVAEPSAAVATSRQVDDRPAAHHPVAAAAAPSDILRSTSHQDFSLSLWPDSDRRPGETLWSSIYSTFAGPSTAPAKDKQLPQEAPAAPGAAKPAGAPGLTRAAWSAMNLTGPHPGAQPWNVNPGSQWMSYR